MTKPSADTMLTAKIEIFSSKFHWRSWLLINYPLIPLKMADKISPRSRATASVNLSDYNCLKFPLLLISSFFFFIVQPTLLQCNMNNNPSNQINPYTVWPTDCPLIALKKVLYKEINEPLNHWSGPGARWQSKSPRDFIIKTFGVFWL